MLLMCHYQKEKKGDKDTSLQKVQYYPDTKQILFYYCAHPFLVKEHNPQVKQRK